MFTTLQPHNLNSCNSSFTGTWLRTVAIIIMMSCNIYAEAQFMNRLKTNNLLLEGRSNYGFLINHHLEMQVYNSHFTAFEINLGSETYGKSHWEAMYDYPSIGISYWYSNLGNSEFVGKANALFPYISFPLMRREKYALNFRAGCGLGYLTQHFDRLSNYKYLAIGSHLNAAVNLLFEIRCSPSPRTELSAGLALMHFSNGSLKTPNFGINIPTASLAFAYRLARKNEYISKDHLPEITGFEFDGHKNTELDISGSLGMKELPAYGKRFYVYALSGNAFKTISYKSKLGVGFDLTYDNSDLYIAEVKQVYIKHRGEIIKPAANLGYQLNLSRTSFIFNMGFYLGGKVKSTADTYFKISTRVMLSQNIFTSLILKSHFAQVDFIGLGLGYKIKFLK